jgi:hypothetical protein
MNSGTGNGGTYISWKEERRTFNEEGEDFGGGEGRCRGAGIALAREEGRGADLCPCQPGYGFILWSGCVHPTPP